MEIKNDGIIGNIPKQINKVVPKYKSNAVRICKLIKDSGEIAGVAVATNKGNDYLRSLPDESEQNNLGNLPSITN